MQTYKTQNSVLRLACLHMLKNTFSNIKYFLFFLFRLIESLEANEFVDEIDTEVNVKVRGFVHPNLFVGMLI